MDNFKKLPSDITLGILSLLPTESILECKLVSKTWNTLIHQPSFSKLHLHRLNHHSGECGFLACGINLSFAPKKFYYIEYNHENHNPIQRIASFNLTPAIRQPLLIDTCNGLICFAGCPSTWICNPITREQVMLPQIINNHLVYGMCGFGYVSSTDEYKIVHIYTYDANFAEVYIYTLGSGKGWRNIGKFSSFKPSGILDGAGIFADGILDGAGIFADGAIYWKDSKLKMVVSFDLAEEKFRERIPPLPFPTGDDECDYGMGVLDGVLYVAVGRQADVVRGLNSCFDVWLLKKKNANQSSVWSKEFRINKSSFFATTASDGFLTTGYNNLSIYDTKTSTSKRLVKFKDSFLLLSPHKNTFISLKELGEEDTKTMESVEVDETEGRDDYSFEQLGEDANPEYA